MYTQTGTHLIMLACLLDRDCCLWPSQCLAAIALKGSNNKSSLRSLNMRPFLIKRCYITPLV